MSDEVQYRCAGFVQAEIDRYAEELEADRPLRDVNSDDDGDISSDNSDVEKDKDKDKANKAAAAKAKKKKDLADRGSEFCASYSSLSSDVNFSFLLDVASRAQLEQEYIFNSTMTTFLRALRAGVIHARHGAVLLAHYGRLGQSFDISVRLMIDILREEGMFKENGLLVVDVVVQALKEVSRLLCKTIMILVNLLSCFSSL